MMMKTELSCTDCGSYLPTEWLAPLTIYACPTCGSTRQHAFIEIDERVGLDIHDSIRGKAKDPSLPSKEKIRTDFFSGDDLRRHDGVWMKKERLIDRNKNLYRETVTDPRTGEIVHHVEEPLSAHVGHGSAKKNPASVSGDEKVPVKPKVKI